MATIEDKFELAVHSLKINQLADTLGSGGWEFGKTCAPSEPEKKMKMSVRGLFTMIFITSQLAGVMSSLNGVNISGGKERKDLGPEGITHQHLLLKSDGILPSLVDLQGDLYSWYQS
ncbi:hypothetical protein LXL04_023543 [Taraxacum kok-saghyz]